MTSAPREKPGADSSLPRRKWGLAAAAGLFLLSLLVLVRYAPRGSSPEQPRADLAPAGPATSPTVDAPPLSGSTATALVFVGETLGWLEPCGCTDGMLGGLARRASYLGFLRSRGLAPILLDLGDLVEKPGRQAELKLDAIVEAYRLMGAGAVCAGERDLPYVARLEAAGLSLLVPGSGKVLVIDTLEGPLAVSVALGPSLRPFFDAEGRPSSTATPAADVILFHGSRDEARAAYAHRMPPPLVIFTGHGDELPPPPERLPSGALVIGAGSKGKLVALVTIRRDPVTGTRTAVPAGPPARLGDRVSDDPLVAQVVERYKDRLFEENLLSQEEQKPPLTGGSYVGPEECASCHASQVAVWKKTGHFHAFEALAPRKGTRDPECLRCHVTGAGYASGFTGPEATPELAHVTCETCHGVGSNHARNPLQPGYGKIKEKRALCVECHDKENSPRFDVTTYWPRIRH